jgi:L-ascorbate metabolism protein UlaG (beta-lactamase superfamily)
MNLPGRRAFLGLSGAAFGAEALSLFGAFDHRVEPQVSGREKTRRGLVTPANAGVVHIGHSTHVIRVGEKRILTDPWFLDPAFGALRHASGPACPIEDLAVCDAIVLSHEHPDHADMKALDRFPRKNEVVVLAPTRELERKLAALGFRQASHFAAWQSFALDAVTLYGVPGLHDVPEIGFVIADGNASVYFAGDTALYPELPLVAERYQPRFAILPVDGLRLRGMAHGTMGARDAALAARILGVSGVMPSHAESAFTDPLAERLLTASTPGGVGLFRRELGVLLPEVA